MPICTKLFTACVTRVQERIRSVCSAILICCIKLKVQAVFWKISAKNSFKHFLKNAVRNKKTVNHKMKEYHE